MKTVAKNRRARFDYEITDTIEAGIVLTGPEVKSCRMGTVNLTGAYLSFIQGAPVLRRMKIAPYIYATQDSVIENERDRLLLLSKSERDRLVNVVHEKGVSVVPLEIRAGKYIKVLLGIGRGRKTIDKRQRIRERETSRRVREGREI
jgi:SsrA-binding protein